MIDAYITSLLMYAISTVCQIFVQSGFHRKFAEMINLWRRDVMGMSYAASGSGIMNNITGGMLDISSNVSSDRKDNYLHGQPACTTRNMKCPSLHLADHFN